MNLLILFLSVVIGVIIVTVFKPKVKYTQILLSFSGAYLLAITLTHLLPEIFHSQAHMEDHGHDVHSYNVSIFILIGLLIQLIMDYFSRGIEHGHMHTHKNEELPKVLFISLCIHAFMEGMPIGHDKHEELLWAVIVHKVPIAIVLSSFLLTQKNKRVTNIILLLVFALMSPLGSLAGANFDFLVHYQNEINAIIVGIFLHISTIIIFESSKDHKINIAKFIAILVGFGIALMI